MLLKPVVFQCLDFPAGLSAVDKLAAFGLQKAFFDMTCQGLPFLVGPAFLCFLSFQGTAEYVFDVGISTTGSLRLVTGFPSMCTGIRTIITGRPRNFARR